MGHGRLPVGALLLATMLLGAVGLAAAAHVGPQRGIAPHAGASQSLTVSVGDLFTFSLTADEITPGDTVTVTLVSLGNTAHNFLLSPIPNFVFNGTDSDKHIDQFFLSHPPLVNLQVNGTAPGEKYSQTFIAPAYGEYEYVCNQSGHFAGGMFGQLGSGEHGSTATVDTGPGWPVFVIGGGIAALVVATIVLAFVIGQRPGSKHEMAPERLGYPENPDPPGGQPPGH
jgi:plastocyanin